MNESENEYQLKILDMAANFCLDKIATPTDENLRFMESNVDKIVWDVATQIYQQSGFQADLARVRNIVISRLENIRYQIQLEAERKAAEAKRLAELQKQAEPKAVEEAKRLSELQKQAEQKAVEEAKRLSELQKQAERKAVEEAKRLSELQEQAEQKATGEVKREPELQEQAERKAVEKTKREAELKAEIFLQLRRVLAEESGVDEEDVNLDSHLADDLGLDDTYGLEIYGLFMAIGEEFEIEISDEDIEKIGFTVRELFDYLYQKINDTTEIGKLEAKRLAKLREQVERKVAKAKGLDELRKQTEGKLAEAQRLAKLREQAEGKLAEAKRLAELREQAEQKAAEQAKCEAELQEQAERKAAEEAKRLDELQKQAEQQAVEEAKRLSELQKQAEQKAVEEAKRLSELQKQAEQQAAEEAKHLSELKDEIFLKLRRVLAEQLAVDEEKVNLDSHLADDLGADGLDGWELSIAIENEFEIEIPDGEAEKIGLFSYYKTNSSPNRLWLVSTSESFQLPNYCPPTLTVGELLDYIYQKIKDTTKTE
ncbi:acyl carrier protein [Limnoraphis robusta]|nr:phosphopantetheine-binding protein [Limnoraphis robusta]MEA5497227.1 phosphopantetheine-binding protein [Limnoraphis robusta BA-68 BA1]